MSTPSFWKPSIQRGKLAKAFKREHRDPGGGGYSVVPEERDIKKFQPGEEVYVRLAFQSVVPLKNIFVVFVHEEDETEQLAQWMRSPDENKPIEPAWGYVDFALRIEEYKKHGVYALDKIRFETFSGNTLDYQGDIGTPKFEVVPERAVAPTVSELSILAKPEWEALRRREEGR